MSLLPEAAQEPKQATSAAGLWQQVLDGFTSLSGSPRELWLAYIIHIFSTFTYHALGGVLVVYLSHEFAMSDEEAGSVYGMWGLIITFWNIALSAGVDLIGVRRSALYGFGITVCSRLLIVTADVSAEVLFALYVIGPLGEGLAEQIFNVGIVRWTNTENRTFAFSLRYAVSNLGGALAGFVIDAIKTSSAVVNGETYTGYRLCLMLSWLTAVTCFTMSLGLRQGVHIADEKPAQAEGEPKKKPEILRDWSTDKNSEQTKNPLMIYRTVASDTSFWRYLLLIALLVPIKLQWHFNNALLPKWLIRLHGRDAPFGSISSINWIICSFLPPPIAAATQNWSHLKTIVIGTTVMGLAPFMLAVDASMGMVILWEVIYTIGECIWSPRILAWASELAPEG